MFEVHGDSQRAEIAATQTCQHCDRFFFVCLSFLSLLQHIRVHYYSKPILVRKNHIKYHEVETKSRRPHPQPEKVHSVSGLLFLL